MRALDADALKKYLLEHGFYPAFLKAAIEKLAIADAEPVIRCKDCKHSYVIIDARCCSRGAFYDVAVPDDFFCAFAERKDSDEK